MDNKTKRAAPVKERLLHYIRLKGIKMCHFERECGLCTGYVTSMRKSIGPDKLNAILKFFPDLNRDWLVYGEGEMERAKPGKHDERVTFPLEDLKIMLSEKEKQIQILMGVISETDRLLQTIINEREKIFQEIQKTCNKPLR